MVPKNFLSLRLQKPPEPADSTDSTAQLEANHDPESHPRPQKRRERSYNFSRIPKLLMLGYASDESQRRYEKQRDWKRMHTILMFKIENISIVSGLLLASSCNLLIAGDLRRMTHAAVSASMFGSILSIVFGLLCRINITSARLEFLVTRSRLFYYLYATPSLWGGGAALAFFVAVCAFTWLEESTTKYGWAAKAASVLMSGLLISNAVACFVLGASVVNMHVEGERGQLEDEQEKKEEEGRKNENADHDELENRNRRPRMESSDTAPGAMAFSSFGITNWGADREWQSSSDQVLLPLRAPMRAATFESVTSSGPLPPRRVQIRRQSNW